MKSVRAWQVDSFTQTPFSGNAAGVVLDADGLTGIQMQNIARELNNSETAFVLQPDADDHDVHVRFFTPTMEVPSCGHATLAAHFVRFTELNIPEYAAVQKTGAGLQTIRVEQCNDDVRVFIDQGRPSFSDVLHMDVTTRILEALGLSQTDRDGRFPVMIASTGHSKVMIGIRERDILNGLQPDMPLLGALSQETGCNGYYVFVVEHNSSTRCICLGRMFAPAIGIDEDPVTGNANGPLAAYLVHQGFDQDNSELFHMSGHQGAAMGRPGEVQVKVRIERNIPVSVEISGNAIMIFQADINL
ncbi:MAG: hypothetical protein COB90_08425 [Hyphomicrobiales bacterium]|nr:MAG: hypothetical protein COB90_08425 [Hyphomicrobiales bacterium]